MCQADVAGMLVTSWHVAHGVHGCMLHFKLCDPLTQGIEPIEGDREEPIDSNAGTRYLH